jgi:carboxypeptidase C (cathepsin A)
MIGMLYENGPFIFTRNTSELKLNNYSWNAKANLLFLESPGSVGFSIGPEQSSD